MPNGSQLSRGGTPIHRPTAFAVLQKHETRTVRENLGRWAVWTQRTLGRKESRECNERRWWRLRPRRTCSATTVRGESAALQKQAEIAEQMTLWDAGTTAMPARMSWIAPWPCPCTAGWCWLTERVGAATTSGRHPLPPSRRCPVLSFPLSASPSCVPLSGPPPASSVRCVAASMVGVGGAIACALGRILPGGGVAGKDRSQGR